MSDSPDLTPEDVREILRLVDESQFDEFELETPRLTIRFRRGESGPVTPASAAAPGTPGRRGPAGPRRRQRADGRDVLPRARAGRGAVREVGSTVEEGTQVCILEVMKLMSAVAAGHAASSPRSAAPTARSSGYGDLLFRIRPA